MKEFQLIKIYEESGLSEVNIDAIETYIKQVEDELEHDYRIIHNSLKLIGDIKTLMQDFLDCFRREARSIPELKPGSEKNIKLFREIKEKLNFLYLEFDQMRKDSKETENIETYIEKHIKHWKKVFSACEKELNEAGFI